MNPLFPSNKAEFYCKKMKNGNLPMFELAPKLGPRPVMARLGLSFSLVPKTWPSVRV
jgi:hypothetical protein